MYILRETWSIYYYEEKTIYLESAVYDWSRLRLFGTHSHPRFTGVDPRKRVREH